MLKSQLCSNDFTLVVSVRWWSLQERVTAITMTYGSMFLVCLVLFFYLLKLILNPRKRLLGRDQTHKCAASSKEVWSHRGCDGIRYVCVWRFWFGLLLLHRPVGLFVWYPKIYLLPSCWPPTLSISPPRWQYLDSDPHEEVPACPIPAFCCYGRWHHVRPNIIVASRLFLTLYNIRYVFGGSGANGPLGDLWAFDLGM